MRLANVSIAKKLVIGFGSVLSVVALSSTFVVVEVKQTKEIERLNDASDRVLDQVDRSRADLSEARASIRKYVLTGSAADKAAYNASLVQHSKDLEEARSIVAIEAPDILPLVDEYKSRFAEFLNFVNKEAALASDPSTRQQAVDMVTNNSTSAVSNAMAAALTALSQKVSAWSDDRSSRGNDAMDRIVLVVMLSGLLSVVIGGATALLIVRAVSTPLSAMTGAMRRLAAGDHGTDVPAVGRKDELGQMADAVQMFKQAAVEKLRMEAETAKMREAADQERQCNAAAQAEAAGQQARVVEQIAAGLEHLSDGDLMFRLEQAFAPDYEKLRADFNAAIAKLQDTISVISGSTSAIRAGTTEISTAADDLSRRTEQQAASLEETAAALDEITATVKKTSEGSHHARKVVADAKADAEHSGEVVGKAVEAMSEIEQSSEKIGQIIGVIDEIAFQTNLLALNAGVEAARAGEAGRGFAVVASEVRALAQRSAEAAKEIKALISTSGQQVNAGVILVSETGTALKRIAAQVTEINAVVLNIATSTQEQATALQEVNTAINQMDQVTQQNAAMVEESTAASRNLATETEELSRLIGQFRVHVGAVAVRSVPHDRPANQPIRALRTTGRGGAARKPAPQEASWEEF